jgi:FkbM family methyltransferase
MKIRNFFELLGLKASPKRYTYSVNKSVLPSCEVRYARWLHPREELKDVDWCVVEEYRKLIRPGDFCIDIGAHSGDSTLPIALATGKTGLVLALEPNPYVYHVLEKNVRANTATTNIVSIMAAAAPSEGFLQMEYSDAGFCNGGRHEGISRLRHGHNYKQQVFAINLNDELLTDFAEWLPKLRFIKLDAEGYDLRILLSLKNIIASLRPCIKTEVYKKSDAVYRARLFEFFLHLDYKVFELNGKGLEPSKQLTAAGECRKAHYDILALPD